MYSKYSFKYNNSYYNEILRERLEMILIREKVFAYKAIPRFITDNYSKKELYLDYIRLSFIIGEPFIGKVGYENVLY